MELPVKIAAAAVKFTYYPAASECRATFSNLDPNVNNVAAYVKGRKHKHRQTLTAAHKQWHILHKDVGGLCSGRCSCSWHRGWSDFRVILAQTGPSYSPGGIQTPCQALSEGGRRSPVCPASCFSETKVKTASRCWLYRTARQAGTGSSAGAKKSRWSVVCWSTRALWSSLWSSLGGRSARDRVRTVEVGTHARLGEQSLEFIHFFLYLRS